MHKPDLGLLQDYKASLQRGGAADKAQMTLLTWKTASLQPDKTLHMVYCSAQKQKECASSAFR